MYKVFQGPSKSICLFHQLCGKCHLRGIHTLSVEVTLSNLFCLPFILPSFQTGISMGSKFFPFRGDPFSERDLPAVKQIGGHKNCLTCQKCWKNLNVNPLAFTVSLLCLWDFSIAMATNLKGCIK